jgi:hypothetical protein
MKKLFVSIETEKKIKSLASDKEVTISIQSHHDGVTTEHKSITIRWDEKKQKVVIS